MSPSWSASVAALKGTPTTCASSRTSSRTARSRTSPSIFRWAGMATTSRFLASLRRSATSCATSAARARASSPIARRSLRSCACARVQRWSSLAMKRTACVTSHLPMRSVGTMRLPSTTHVRISLGTCATMPTARRTSSSGGKRRSGVVRVHRSPSWARSLTAPCSTWTCSSSSPTSCTSNPCTSIKDLPAPTRQRRRQSTARPTSSST